MVKWADMYTKVAPDLEQATRRGGIFSVVAAVLMAYMFFVETAVFIGTGPVRERIDLDATMKTSDALRMNINLEFPRLMCEDLTMELWRAKQRIHHPKYMETTVVVSRLNPETGKKRAYQRVNNPGNAPAVPKGFEGCALAGFVNGYNSPGAFKVSAPPGRNMSHTIKDFTFGTPPSGDQRRQLTKLAEKYRMIQAGTLAGADYFYHANDKVFHHFIHVVPTNYALHGRKNFMAYQTLHQSHLSHHDADEVDHWAAQFGFDVSPYVAVVTNRGSTRWYDFVTNLLAILGGTFTTVQLVERTAGALF